MAMTLALSPIQHVLRKRSTPPDQSTSFLNMSEPLETHEYVCQPMTDWLVSILGIRKIKMIKQLCQWVSIALPVDSG